MRKIDKNPFPFAIWPDNTLEKAGTRVNDPAYAGKTKALIGALADQNEEFMPLGPEWGVGTFASQIGDHGAYAGTFNPEDGTLYIDWLGMNPEGNLNDPETRQKLLDQWYRMGVQRIKYKPETDTTMEAIPHLQLGKVYNDDGTVRYEEKRVQSAVHMPKNIASGWTPASKYGVYKKTRGGVETEGTIDDILRESRELGEKVRNRLFQPLIDYYVKMRNTHPDPSSFGSVTVPTPTPTISPSPANNNNNNNNVLEGLSIERQTPKPPKTPVPPGTWRPLSDSEKKDLEAQGKVISRIHPDYHSNIIERYGLGTPTPVSPASNMTMPTPTPTPVQTPVKPVVPTTIIDPMPSPTPTPVQTPVKPVVPTTIIDPMPSPTPKPEGITAPSPTEKADGFSVPKIQPNNNWFNFAMHPAIKQP
jgi:hypothetical protein